MNGDEDESGATATAIFVRDDMLLISHLGDSSVVRVIHPCGCGACFPNLNRALNGKTKITFQLVSKKFRL